MDLTKLARVFGDTVNKHLTEGSDVPMSDRKRELHRYIASKSREAPTSKTTASLTGGGLGVAGGALMGAALAARGSRGKGALVGGVTGGLGGAGLGLLARWMDKGRINSSRAYMKVSPAQQKKALHEHALKILQQRDANRALSAYRDKIEQADRHYQLMREIRSR